jgi:micrococcal nuclease
MKRAGLLLLYFCAFAAAHGGEFTARVIAVLDGDTVMVLRDSGPPVKVRLADIDAPEKEQPGGIASKKSLSDLVLHKQVNMTTQATDIYGRLVAHLTVDGKSINEEQLRRGMAWAAVGWRQSRRAVPRPPEGRESDETTSQSTRFANNANQVAGYDGVPHASEFSNYHSNKTYIELQREAQQAKRGLWAGAEIIEPAQWRKLHATEAPVTQSHAQPSIGANAEFTCGRKRLCSQMFTCDEAHFYLSVCGVKSLDPNHDGVPCEHLCGGR